ncbi:MAG: choice-of-anchor tandem repeat GloVer-containing protein [Candidatus Sulfotelmatobacter sp.]
MERSKRLSFTGSSVRLFAFLAVLSVYFCTLAYGQRERLLHSFGGSGDGSLPKSGLTSDGHGNLYGVTYYGGAFGAGTVFELSPPAQGQTSWTETVLHSFQGPPTDGWSPTAGVALDKSGNVYGTTSGGGPTSLGVIYELSPPAAPGGAWTETLIYDFGNQHISSLGGGGVGFVHGSLYAVTTMGGEGFGNVLELKPPVQPGGTWLVKQIFAFNGGSGGTKPLYQGGALTADAEGNLYGTAMDPLGEGGAFVFELSPPSSGFGPWTETVLSYIDSYTVAPLVFDQAGNLYVTANTSEEYGPGAVYQLQYSPGAAWTTVLLYSFNYDDPQNGWYTPGGLVFDKAGNLYGVTSDGGTGAQCAENGCGTVFELSPQLTFPWAETTLYSFMGGTKDASDPFTALTIDPARHLYGIAAHGGTYNGGAAFEVLP